MSLLGAKFIRKSVIFSICSISGIEALCIYNDILSVHDLCGNWDLLVHFLTYIVCTLRISNEYIVIWIIICGNWHMVDDTRIWVGSSLSLSMFGQVKVSTLIRFRWDINVVAINIVFRGQSITESSESGILTENCVYRVG